MKRMSCVIAALLAGIAAAAGAEPVVTVRAVAPAEGWRAGQPGLLTLELSIREPYHINSDRPREDYLIPTTVRFTAQPGVTFGRVVFPPAVVKKLPFSQEPMSIYEGAVTLTAEVTPARDVRATEIVVEGYVGYQACDDQSCLPPARAPFRLAVPVSPAGEAGATPPAASPSDARAPDAPGDAAAAVQPDEGGGAQAGAAGGAPPPAAGSAFGERGLPMMLLLVFVGGLALNLTPCVYPMIPITISYFGGQSQGKKGSMLLHAAVYVLGMALTYSILGSMAALTGSLFGAALQYPPVLVGLALVMVLLALSMFDVYELRVPGSLNRLAGSSRQGLFGTLFMGLTVGIVAAPCIGPFVLGLLTYVGKTGNPLLGFTLFFVLALGLGLPFLFLGFFSGSLSRLPRSGGWMVWVRKIFGFVLIGMAIYFLEPLFPGPLFYSLALAFTMLLGGIYLAWVEPTQAKGKGFAYVRNVVGLVFFGAALYMTASGVQAHVDETLLRRMQSQPAGGAAGTIRWLPYAEARLQEAARIGKPVFIDFYADWCLPCKELDSRTFSDPEVIRASENFVMLKADLTSADEPGVKELQKKYQVLGVPTLVFLRPDGSEMSELRVTGFEPKEVFLPRMMRALDQAGAAR
jgi:thiol:disulfide interchange protein DsbD